jgi:uridine kinase
MTAAAEIKPYLIGVAGPSCAGKTELSRRLASRLNASLLPLDCYYFDLSNRTMEERARFNFDEPSALDHDLFLAQLQDLASGRAIDRPVYDFATHSRTAMIEKVPRGRFIIVEGLFVLHWEDVREVFGTKVFVDLEDEPCLERRIYRDVRERGRTRESVIRQVKETVEPMAALYIRPTRLEADLVVRGDAPIEASVAEVMAHVQRHLSVCAGR